MEASEYLMKLRENWDPDKTYITSGKWMDGGPPQVVITLDPKPSRISSSRQERNRGKVL